jgi:tetratricopeptide (TPR) repeat protein
VVSRFEYNALGHIANGYALAGYVAAAESILAQMDSLSNTGDFRPGAIGEQVRAVIALHEGRPEESLEHLRLARAAEYGLRHHPARLLMGDSYVALGRLADAVVQYDSLVSTYRLFYGDMATYGPLLPLAHERLGTTYLALGDTTLAVRHLAAFVELWQDADPELQPRVQDVKQRLARLVGEPQ